MTFELAGFKTVRREDIRLTVGFTARVDAAMSVGALAETFTVSGASPLVDTASPANSTQLTRETLELLPTSRSSYNAILMQTPSARMPANRVDVGGSQFANSPRFYALGQLGDSWHSIENIIAMSPADNPSGNYIDYSAMDETVVSIGGHSADTPNMGLQLNAIVKSGGNDFTGSAYYAYTGRRLQSDNIGRYTNIIAPERLEYRDDANFELGGRLVPNKLWFFGSFTAPADRRDCRSLQEAGWLAVRSEQPRPVFHDQGDQSAQRKKPHHRVCSAALSQPHRGRQCHC